MHRLRLSYLTTAAWAVVQVIRARRALRRGLPEPGLIHPPPRLSGDDPRPMLALLHRTGATCLVRSLVHQAWDVAHGTERDVIIGVTRPADFQAHAWLDGQPGEPTERFTELVRIPAR